MSVCVFTLAYWTLSFCAIGKNRLKGMHTWWYTCGVMAECGSPFLIPLCLETGGFNTGAQVAVESTGNQSVPTPESLKRREAVKINTEFDFERQCRGLLPSLQFCSEDFFLPLIVASIKSCLLRSMKNKYTLETKRTLSLNWRDSLTLWGNMLIGCNTGAYHKDPKWEKHSVWFCLKATNSDYKHF